MAGPRLSIIPAAAVTDPRLTPRALQVLCLLGRHMDDRGWCRVRQTKLAGELGCARSTIQAALDLLYEAQWVERRLEGRPGCAAPDDEKQPYASHAYRVILDTEEAASSDVGVPDTPAPVPDQPAPRADPIASAPNERSLDNEGERERTRTRETKRLPVTAFLKRWPSAAVDSRTAIEREWEALPDDLLQSAVDGIERFIAELKRHKRSHVPSGATYLHERKWADLPVADDAKGKTFMTFAVWSREWWAMILARADRGESISFQVDHAKEFGTRETSERVDRMPPADVIASLRSMPGDGLWMRAWRPWFEQRGAHLPYWTHRVWVFLPSADPPASGKPALGSTGPPTSPTTMTEDDNEALKEFR